jgi:hypothetical protein
LPHGRRHIKPPSCRKRRTMSMNRRSLWDCVIYGWIIHNGSRR